jgi:signal transduction histidine kinase
MSEFSEVPPRRKITTIVVLGSVLSVGLSILALLAYQCVVFEGNTVNYVSSQAAILGAATQSAVLASDKSAAEAALVRIKSDQHITAACIYNRDGGVMASYVRAGTFEFPIPELDSHRFDNGALLVFHHVEAGNEVVGNVFLRYESGSRFAGLTQHAAFFGGMVGSVLLVVVLLIVVSRRIAKPAMRVDGFPEITNEILPHDSQDELLKLNDRVNEVLQKLQTIEKQLAKQNVHAEPRTKKHRAEPLVPFVPIVAKDELTCSTLDLNAATSRVLQLLRDDINAKNADINVQPNLPVVWANREIVEQVLTNLISNALKFAPANGRPRIRVGGCATRDAVRLWVHDNGIGFAPEQQQRVFAADENAGLSVVKQGIERMHGQVGVDSAAGQGSTFWIELPKSQAA